VPANKEKKNTSGCLPPELPPYVQADHKTSTPTLSIPRRRPDKCLNPRAHQLPPSTLEFREPALPGSRRAALVGGRAASFCEGYTYPLANVASRGATPWGSFVVPGAGSFGLVGPKALILPPGFEHCPVRLRGTDQCGSKFCRLGPSASPLQGGSLCVGGRTNLWLPWTEEGSLPTLAWPVPHEIPRSPSRSWVQRPGRETPVTSPSWPQVGFNRSLAMCPGSCSRGMVRLGFPLPVLLRVPEHPISPGPQAILAGHARFRHR